MSDESTPEPQPTPDEPSGDDVSHDAPEGDTAPRKGFLAHFPRAPIPGTDLSVRTSSVAQDMDNYTDMANEELDDREFTVGVVHRQLDADMPIDEVRSWDDELLLAAAGAFLSLDRHAYEEDDDQEQAEGGDEPSDDDSEAAKPDEGDTSVGADPTRETDQPVTFAAFRAAIRRQSDRRAKRLNKMFAGISSLANAGRGPGLTAVMKAVETSAFSAAADRIRPLGGIDLTKITGGIAASSLSGIDLKGLAGTSAFGDSLKKMVDDVQGARRLTLPELDMRTSVPHQLYERINIAPVVRPEIGLLRDVNESLEKMHDDQVRSEEHQIEVLIEQAQLIKRQGEALEALVSDARSQKLSRRLNLGAALIMAIAAVITVLFAAGFLHAAGTTSPSPTPVASSAPAVPSSSPMTAP